MLNKRKILILGGTEFVGRQLVDSLLRDTNNELFLFNRGRTNPGLFPQAKHIVGDRETDDIQKISDQKWDYVIDFSCYFPHVLEQTLNCLNTDVKKYIFISTISVYAFAECDLDAGIYEDSAKKNYQDVTLTDSMKYYGERKMACEDILKGWKGLNWTILRPSIIYGAYDPTDRLYYWMKKIKDRNVVIVPNGGERSITLTYARDFVKMIETQLNAKPSHEAYNCTTHSPTTFSQILQIIRDNIEGDTQYVAVGFDELLQEGIKLTQAFPLCFSIDLRIDSAKVMKQSSIVLTPFAESIKLTIQHYQAMNWRPCSVGLKNDLEDALLNRISERRF